jgi:hypothetical protein
MNKFSNPTRVAEAALAIIFAPMVNPEKKSNWNWKHKLNILKCEVDLFQSYDTETTESFELYGIEVGRKKLEPEKPRNYYHLIEFLFEKIKSDEKQLEKISHIVRKIRFSSYGMNSTFMDSVKVETFRLTSSQKEQIISWVKY